MKTTIEKQFDKLAVGDIVMRDGVRLAVAHISKRGTVQCVSLAGPLIFTMELGRGAGEPVQVEIERLVAPMSPAQQHADELLALVRKQVTTPQRQGGFEYDAQKLLDKIDPPKPVTLDEALVILVTMGKADADPLRTTTQIRELLDRARRSGMLGAS